MPAEDTRRWLAVYVLCVGTPASRAEPLPGYDPGAGCAETGMRVVIGGGGCAGSAP